MAKIKISELPKAININDNDSLVILQGNTTKSVSVDKITSKVVGIPGQDGADGATFTPTISEDGTLSWENNKGLRNPDPINIKGKDGRDGAQGIPGTPGRDGSPGEQGPIGKTPNITIGEVTTLEPGQKATVTNTGTIDAPVFNFGIPKGQQGIPGQDGEGGSSIDLTGYQTVTDESLQTTDKTIPGAVNELKDRIDNINIDSVDEIYYSIPDSLDSIDKENIIVIEDTVVEKPVITPVNTNDIEMITSKSNGDIIISLKGTGEVTINYNGTTQNKTLTANSQNVTVNITDNTKPITITNPNLITELVCIDSELKSILLNNCSAMKKIVLYNNSIEKLDCSSCVELQYLHIHNNPLIASKTFYKTIRSLPSRIGKPYGSIVIDNRDVMHKIEDVALAKDWLFGSAIQYNPTEFAKVGYHLKGMGVVDIWESGEYGEGITYCVLDVGLNTKHNLFKDNLLTTYNASEHGNPNEVLEPEGRNKDHGNMISAVLLADGSKYNNNTYGMAPKSKFHFIKIGDNEGSSYYGYLDKAMKHVVNSLSDVEIVNLSFSFHHKFPNEPIIEWLDVKKKAFTAAAGNAGDNNASIDDAPNTYHKKVTLCGGYRENNSVYNGTSSPKVDISAYCTNINSGISSGRNGTSYSAPLIAGAIGLMKNILKKKLKREPSYDEVHLELLKRTELHGADPRSVGAGLLNFMAYNENPYTNGHV